MKTPALIFTPCLAGLLGLSAADWSRFWCVNASTGETVYQERLAPAPGLIYASGVMAEDLFTIQVVKKDLTWSRRNQSPGCSLTM